MKKSFKILLATLLIVSFSFSSIYAKMTKEEIKKDIEEASANLTDEQKSQIQSAAYQIAYKVMSTAINKSLSALEKVNTKLDDEALAIPEETKTIIEDQIADIEDLLTEQQANLNNADSIDDLKSIQEDLVAGLMENAKELQKIFLDKSDELIAQADAALTALEATCGADVSSQQAQLDELSKKIDQYELDLENGETMTKEELQKKLQEMNPEEIQSQMQDLAADMQDLQGQCPTVQ